MVGDKEWDDYLSGNSVYGIFSPRFGFIENHKADPKVTRVSRNEVHVEGGCPVVGNENLLNFYFGKGGKK